MTIEVEYQEQLITYDERNDRWKCAAMGLSADTLSALKAKIAGKLTADAPVVDAFYLTEGKRVPVSLVLVASRFEVWGTHNGKRQLFTLRDLSPATPAADAAFTEYSRKRDLVEQARTEARTAYMLLPRVKIEDLSSLPSRLVPGE